MSEITPVYLNGTNGTLVSDISGECPQSEAEQRPDPNNNNSKQQQPQNVSTFVQHKKTNINSATSSTSSNKSVNSNNSHNGSVLSEGHGNDISSVKVNINHQSNGRRTSNDSNGTTAESNVDSRNKKQETNNLNISLETFKSANKSRETVGSLDRSQDKQEDSFNQSRESFNEILNSTPKYSEGKEDSKKGKRNNKRRNAAFIKSQIESLQLLELSVDRVVESGKGKYSVSSNRKVMFAKAY